MLEQTPTANALNRLEVFTGGANPAEARIYARLKLLHEEAVKGWCLTGRVVGPECLFSHTLPARMPMMNRGNDGTLLLEAAVPDPCFWTPELPFLYCVRCELQTADGTIAKGERLVGIRRLGVRNGCLYFDGKRFVLRGVKKQAAGGGRQQDEAYCRETWTAVVADKPDNEFCESASRNGVLIIADATEHASESSLTDELRRLAQWPSVAIAIVNGNATIPAGIHEIARNLLLAQRFAADEPLRAAPWAQLAIVEIGQPQSFADQIAGCCLPVIAFRPKLEVVGAEAARAACDALQRDLAPIGSFAGYVV